MSLDSGGGMSLIPSQNGTEASVAEQKVGQRVGVAWVQEDSIVWGSRGRQRAFPSKCIGKTLQGFKQESNVTGFTSF